MRTPSKPLPRYGAQAADTFITVPIPIRTPSADHATTLSRTELPLLSNVGPSSAGKGILIGMLSAFGSALLIVIILGLVYLLRYTARGRIFLDRIGRPGEYDDEQAFAKEEAEALEEMDDIQRAEYMRAKAFVEANPPESAQTDISLSQFLAIQEKGVSAWEFEPELEIANCFVEGRTEIEFFDMECSVQSNLPVPKQNDVYYWEAKVYDKPESTSIAFGMTTKPYPMFRLPGYHKTSVAYTSPGDRRFNQPFKPNSAYGPPYVQGDVVGCGYRPRTGTVFFTRNGKKLEDVTHALKTQNLFPTVGATGPCTVHVNFGQAGFVFIEANVKRWGLAPMTGSLAPPPPYGSEQGSILLEGGHAGVHEGQGWANMWGGGHSHGHGRTRSATVRTSRHQPRSPGPQRSPTDISLAQLSLIDSAEDLRGNTRTATGHTDDDNNNDAGEGTSSSGGAHMTAAEALRLVQAEADMHACAPPPPGYTSPEDEGVRMELERRRSLASEAEEEMGNEDWESSSTPRPGTAFRDLGGGDEERRRLLGGQRRGSRSRSRRGGDDEDGDEDEGPSPPIPSYEVAVGSMPRGGYEHGHSHQHGH